MHRQCLASILILRGDSYLVKIMLNKLDLYGEKYGLGIVLAGGNAGIGRYEIATA